MYDIGPIKMVEQAGKSATSTTNPIILNSDRNVKENFADIDTIGRELSEGQKKYFKDSTVRDENGSLLVVYHGSPELFTIFDTHKDTSSIIYDASFFTSDESKAKANCACSSVFAVYTLFKSAQKDLWPLYDKNSHEYLIKCTIQRCCTAWQDWKRLILTGSILLMRL